MSQKTKKKLAAALKQLLHEKTLEKMTISDLADLCEINRKTFYYHFHDIYELVDWTVAEDFRMAMGEDINHDNWQAGYLNVLKTARSDPDFLLGAFPDLVIDHVGSGLGIMVYELVGALIAEKAEGMDVAERDKQIMADFYMHAIIGLTVDWLRNGMADEPEYIAGLVGEIMHGNIDKVLNAVCQTASRKSKRSL